MEGSKGRKVLVVDDDLDLCRMLVKLLGRKGYEVDYVLSGEDALEKVYKGPFDLIILDIMMPGIDGYEVCHKLKMHREYNRIPILMLSAKDTEQDKITGLQTGADDYVFKPFEVSELLGAMEEVLRRHEV
ncbi:MAG: response regulator, partial [bacterium]